MATEPARKQRRWWPSAPVLEPGHTYASVTDKISSIVLTRRQPRSWIFGFAIAFGLLNVFLISVFWLFYVGIGIWGNNIPVGWAWDIINFVWWIGIGHAGTLISAVLLLVRQEWRTSINRFAEAMTLFAVACAGMYPILHLGRPWLFYWLAPYPNTMWLWPQFRSPLIWDFFAISTYATVSLLFWYVGLIPDLATLRDRSRHRIAKTIYGMFALGWRGSARHWHRYETAYLLLAGISTPLVVSVHSIVSFDFASGIVPGWHTTVFPPYFVAGAVFAGFAMVLTICIPLRRIYGLKDFITMHHIDNMARVMLTTGLIVLYGYLLEVWQGYYSANIYEEAVIENRFFGPYAWSYWALFLCNAMAIQFLWFEKIRLNTIAVWIIAMFVNVGMWLERFVIIVISLSRDFIPAEWANYHATWWDVSNYVGTIGLFFTLMFLFIRLLPVISIFEMRELVSRTAPATHDVDHHEPPHPSPTTAPSAAD